MDPSSNDCCVLVHGFLIAYEVVDKIVDLFVVEEYDNRHIANDPEDSVHDALMAFFVIGLHITILRVLLYLWRIQLYRTGDDSRDETHNLLNVWTSSAKVWLEAFPQSTIAEYYFGDCAPEYSNDSLVRVFDAFTIIAFLLFLGYLVNYYCTKENEVHTAITVFMFITFLLSVIGVIFAGKSMNDFEEGRKNCRSRK